MMWISSHLAVAIFVICAMEKVLATNLKQRTGFRHDGNDNQPPHIECPDDVTGSTDPTEPTRRVEWRRPFVIDNSGHMPTVASFPKGVVSPHAFPIGKTRIIYTATDHSGNSGSCVFTITVTDDEPPNLTCPKDMEVKKTNVGPTAVVHWPLPTYKDNSGEPVALFTEAVMGSRFKVGRHQITYMATDQSGNKASCTFTITVSGPICAPYAPPLNGLMACAHSHLLDGSVCTPQCNLHMDFTRIPANMYICQSTGQWFAWDGRPLVSQKLPWPHCTDVAEPGSFRKGTRWQNFAGDCSNPAVQRLAKQNLLQGLVSVFGQHMGIAEHEVSITCGETDRNKKSNLVRKSSKNQSSA